MKTVSTKVNSGLYDQLSDSCNESGCSVSEKLRELIENHANGSSYDMKESLPLATDPKEIIKEVIKEVPKIEYRDRPVEKIVEVPKPYPVEKIVEKRKEVAPDYLPSYNCSEGCTHRNKNYTKRVKSKCDNCDQFNKNETGKCAWCGSTDLSPIDKDELLDLGIPLPNYDTPHLDGLPCPNSDPHCNYIFGK